MTICMPLAGGVPGLPQPPTWPELLPVTGNEVWPRGAPSQSDPPGLDDPRWRTAVSVGFPASPGGMPEAVFRACVRNEGAVLALYLSWWVRVDGGDAGADRLWIGFRRSNTDQDPLILEIQPFLQGGGVPVGNEPESMTPWTVSGPSGPGTVSLAPWAHVDTPDWAEKNTHVWLSTTGAWAVQMRVPIGSAGIKDAVDLTDDFALWFEIRRDLAGPVVPHVYPTGIAEVDYPPNGTPEVPDPDTWQPARLASGPGGPCPTTGTVTISPPDVGTTNAPSSEIQFTDPIVGPNTIVNTFRAQPLNQTGGDIPAGGISASFRIADWGSQIGVGGSWLRITPTSGSNPAVSSAVIPDGTKAAIGNIGFQWQLSPTDINQFEPVGTKTEHQCVLVTLEGAGLTFQPSAVYRNMDVVSASVFERRARISNEGLGQSTIPGQPRDAYILVHKRNMPARVEARRDLARTPGLESERVLARIHPDLLEESERQSTWLTEAEAGYPMIRYHVYHDTGRRTHSASNGAAIPVLAPGLPFGFFVSHEGGADGWADDISGADPVADRLYLLRVPEEGSAFITTRIMPLRSGCIGWLVRAWDWIRSVLPG